MEYTVTPPAPASPYTVKPAAKKPAYTVAPPAAPFDLTGDAQKAMAYKPKVEDADSGILSQAGSVVAAPFKAAAQGVKSIAAETMKEGVQNAYDIKGDLTAPIRGAPKQGVGNYVVVHPGSQGYEKPGALDYAARAGKTVLDVAQRPAIPAYAAVRQTLGRSAQEATGGKVSPDAVANAAMLAAPFGGEIKTLGKMGAEAAGKALARPAAKAIAEDAPKAAGVAMPAEGPLAHPVALTQPRKFEDQLFQLESNRVADKLDVMKAIDKAPDVPPATWEKLYHHEENPEGVKLTPEEQQVYDQHIAPMTAESNKLYKELEATTGEKLPDDPTAKGYTPRYAVAKTRSFSEILDRWKRGVDSEFSGGAGARSMRKTVDAQKSRRFYNAVSPDGEKMVVHIGKDGKVSAFDGSDDPAGPEFGQFPRGQKIAPGSKLRAEGQTWRLENATTKEIEDVASTRYHKNLLANRLDNLAKLRAAVRNAKFIEAAKQSPEWQNVAAKVTDHPVDVPETNGKKWIIPKTPQFSQYYMEPDLAHALDDARGRARDLDGLTNGIDKAGNLIKGSIFYDPFPHMKNEFSHYFVEKGLAGNVRDLATGSTYRSLLRAARAVATQNEDFMRSLRAGAALPYARTLTADLHKTLTTKLGEDVAKNPGQWDRIAKMGGYANPIEMVKAVYKASNKALWGVGDTFRVARHLELMEKGLPLEKAIAKTEEHMPNYRIPGKVLGSRMMSQVLQSPLATMFGRYQYNRMASYMHMARDLVDRSNTIKDKAAAMDKLAALGFTLAIYYPAMDKAWQAVTGNKNARVTRAGAAAVPQAALDLASGRKGPEQAFESTFSPGILSKPFELAQGRYMYSGQPIAYPENLMDGHPDQFARDIGDWIGGSISPVGQLQRGMEGKQSAEQFLLSQLGVQTPTDTQQQTKEKYAAKDKNYASRRAERLKARRKEPAQ